MRITATEAKNRSTLGGLFTLEAILTDRFNPTMSFKSHVNIQARGSYFQTDEDGHLINPASMQKVQDDWWPVIADVVQAYQRHYAEKLENVYVRGSVAKGEAVAGLSDIDTFAFVKLSPAALSDHKIPRALREGIEAKHGFVEGVEMVGFALADAGKHAITLNQSVCVYGQALAIPKIKPGREMAVHAPTFHLRFLRFETFYNGNQGEKERQKACVWFMKGLLRAGFELTMERARTYTRDLYRCHEMFSLYYPEKEADMREVLDLAINPTADKEKMKYIMTHLGGWLLSEIPKHFETKQRS